MELIRDQWYWIEYGKRNKHRKYNGPGKYLHHGVSGAWGEDEDLFFSLPCCENIVCFREKDIVRKLSEDYEPPTYEDLLGFAWEALAGPAANTSLGEQIIKKIQPWIRASAGQ